MSATLVIGPLRIEDALLLAPMEDVSSAPFRRICRRFGADIVYSEFVSAQALVRDAHKSHLKLRVGPDERPLGMQIFGETVDVMTDAARIVEAAGPDFIDLNIGCPVRKIICKGAGAALLKNLDLAERIAGSVVKAVALPVTAKARIGWDADSICVEELARRLEGAGVRALTVHARTRAQGYRGRADWSWIARAKRAVRMPVIGNGDVASAQDARRMFDETGCDGVMIGRAAIGDPWIFGACRRFLATGETPPPPSLDERLALLLEHLEASVAERGERRGVIEMRRQFAAYLKGLRGVSHVRAALVKVDTVAAVRAALERARATLWKDVA